MRDDRCEGSTHYGCACTDDDAGYNRLVNEGIYIRAEDPEVIKYHLTEQQGKAVQEILNRYLSELRVTKAEVSYPGFDPADLREVIEDIDYIEGLAKLFD